MHRANEATAVRECNEIDINLLQKIGYEARNKSFSL